MQKAITKFLGMLMLVFPAALLAQDSTSAVSTTTVTQTTWYTQPWVWLVGGVIVLLLLIAIFSGGKKTSSDKVVITKTVRTESE
ncbi:MAG: hypothetical protein JSR00_01990 [Bacteroidetes bacterium]|nr:hypothetical protein [Bacteroidota bacterium]